MSTQEKIEKMLKKAEVILAAGGEKRVAKQHESGKMTARERIAALLDEGSFVELDRFVRHRCYNFGQEKKELPGEGVTTGYGTIDGRLVYVFAQDFTVEGAPIVETGDDPMRTDDSLNTLLPDNSNQAYDMYDVIRSIVDNGEFYENQKYWATNIITCFARMDGQTVGIIANQPKVMAGCLDINASDKSARFIRFCDAFGIPLLNLVDVPGFLPGCNQEYGGIIRHGAKMLYAYSEATVPKITLVTRKAYGGSYLAMCSQDLGADQVIAWPTAEIAVMGPAGAANIIFRKDPDVEAKTKEYIDNFATPYQAAMRGMVDMVIEPKNTRPTIINALQMLESKRETRPAKRHGNIPL